MELLTHSKTLKSDNQDQIIVATLNYGGILNSPFEFYSNYQVQEKQISNHFKQLLPLYFQDFNQTTFSWKIGKIDQKIQKDRYTPIYNQTAGLQNSKLISPEKFNTNWNQAFIKALSKAKLEKEPTQQEKQSMRTFDLICYHALLRYTYQIKDIKQVQNKNGQKYKNLLNKFFSRSYLNEKKKIQKVLKSLIYHEPLINVIFFQQPTEILIKCIEEQQKYVIAKGQKDNSIIAVRNQPKLWKNIQTFQEIKAQEILSIQEIHKIEANKQTRILFCNRIIFICVHLSSKSQKNKKQLAQLNQGIRILRQKYPTYDLVIGGDTNTFVTGANLTQQKDSLRIHIHPNNIDEITTCKKRTYLQPQFNKADKINAECKDQLMSTLQMKDSWIITIQGQQANDKFNLPTDSHPFDHFLVAAAYLKRKSAY